MSPNEEAFANLLKRAKEEFGFSVDKVKELLKKHGYSGFRAEMFDIYLVCLRAEWFALDDQAEMRAKQLEEKKQKGEFIPIPCPVCGAPTIGNLTFHGKFTKKQGWECKKGGIKHFLWAKANEVREKQGKEVIAWERFIDDTSPAIQDSTLS